MISVVISSWNKKDLTKRSVESFLLCFDEVIVVDNGSKDGTLEMLSTIQNKKLKVIANKENLGFSKAMNQGIENATNEFVLLTQNDVFIGSDGVRNVIKLFSELPDCEVIGMGGGFLDGYTIIEITRLNGDEMNGYNDKKRFNPIEVDFVAGFFMLCERDFLYANNIRFDVEYNPYWEDVDFCNQIQKCGGRCYMVPEILIPYRHIRSATITPMLGVEERERRREMSFIHYKSKWSPMKSELYEEYKKGSL